MRAIPAFDVRVKFVTESADTFIPGFRGPLPANPSWSLSFFFSARSSHLSRIEGTSDGKKAAKKASRILGKLFFHQSGST